MAWDSKTPRRRAISSATTKILTPEAVITPKSTHTSDPAIRPFLAADFDPIDFLNATLPPLQTSGVKPSRSEETAVPLAELSTQTQTLLSHLSAHTARLTTTLTQLTDEILRSGSRLAYEVEILRGETLGLSETLTEGLQDDVTKFVPGGLERHLTTRRGSKGQEALGNRRQSTSLLTPKTPVFEEIPVEANTDPIYITRLRTLTLVRNRLETVIQTFGDAMAWTFPPSEVSVGSAFLSVSAPEPGSEAYSIEEKGQEVSKKLRDEIAELLDGREDPVEGVEAAAQRIERLKDLVAVWHGTAEEKSRQKFVESLAKMVEDRHRELLREAEEARKQTTAEAGPSQDETSRTESSSEGRFGWSGGGQSGYGFINQLQKMRGGL